MFDANKIPKHLEIRQPFRFNLPLNEKVHEFSNTTNQIVKILKSGFDMSIPITVIFQLQTKIISKQIKS